MSDYGATRNPEPQGGWAIGGYVFAGCLMVLIGILQALVGLAAILEDDFFVVSSNYVFELDVTAWGWIHLLLGLVVAFAGFGLFSARTWARGVGIFLAGLSVVANFFFVPYYPFWSLLLISLAVWVIWALTRPVART